MVLEYKVYVYNFADLRLMHHFETISNPKGEEARVHADGTPAQHTCTHTCPSPVLPAHGSLRPAGTSRPRRARSAHARLSGLATCSFCSSRAWLSDPSARVCPFVAASRTVRAQPELEHVRAGMPWPAEGPPARGAV